MSPAQFAWTNLPTALLKGLARDVGLDTSDPVKALGAEYGAVPTEDLVADTLASLRERWLAHDPEVLGAVVGDLWQRSRDGYRLPSTAKERLEWLRGRNNTSRLREFVLRQFISAGQRPASERDPGGNKLGAFAPPRMTVLATNPSTPPEQVFLRGQKKARGALTTGDDAMPSGEGPLHSIRKRGTGGPQVITGTMKSQVDKVWDAFWSGGDLKPPGSDRADHVPSFPAPAG